MKITPIPHGLDLQASNLVRSPGLHMSKIYGEMYQALEPKRFKGGDFHPVLTMLGTAFENHLEFLLDKNGIRVMRPGELFTTDGIAYSPDGILEDEYRLVEYKYSSMGTRDLPKREAARFPPKFDKYVTQLMSYCFHMETNKARLYFCSTHQAHAPELLVFDVEFTSRELQNNWRAMINFAKSKGML